MATADIRLGILGAARIAPAAVIRPARAVPGIVVDSVAARDPARADAFARRHGIARVHRSYDDMLADRRVDAVYIPLPNGLHGAWTARAIEAGKHVLCEKPLTANADEARAVAEVAAAHPDRVVMEAFHWRYHPMTGRILDIVASGELGEVRHLDAAFAFPLLKRHDIRWSRALAGGGLLDAGCYAVHQVRTVGCAVAGVEPMVTAAAARLTPGGVDRALRGTLRFVDGPTAAVRCGLLDPRRPVDVHLRVEGTRGTLHAFNPVLPHLGGHLRVRTPEGRRFERADRTPSYVFQMRAFVAAVNEGRPFPTDVADAVANMAVLDDLQRAAGVTPPEPAAPGWSPAGGRP